jgi:uncharacterized protein (TIGR02118 family)
MIKLAFCIKRLPGMSSEDFHDYWRNRHADLVMSYQSAIGFKRYVQFHADYAKLSAKAAEFRHSPEPYDGVAEMWWQDEATMIKASATDRAREGFAALYEDEKNFIDVDNSPMWYGTEHLIYDEENDG